MSRQEIRDQAALLTRPGTVVRCVDDGENVVVILEPFTPPNAAQYNPHKLDALAFIVPSLYPDACPDATGFYVKPLTTLLASTGAEPRSTAETALLGEQWRKFSWAPKTFKWDPNTDTLATHLATIEVRFRKGD